MGGWCLRLHHNSCLCFYPLQIGRGPEIRVILRYSQQNHWHNTGCPKNDTFWIAVLQNWVWWYAAFHCQLGQHISKRGPAIRQIRKCFFGTPCFSLTSHCHDNDHLVKPACMFTSQPKTDPKLVTPTCLAKNIELWDKCSMTITTPTLTNNYSYKQHCIDKSSYKQDGQTQIPLQTLFANDNPIPNLGRPPWKKVISYNRLLKTSWLPSLAFI